MQPAPEPTAPEKVFRSRFDGGYTGGKFQEGDSVIHPGEGTGVVWLSVNDNLVGVLWDDGRRQWVNPSALKTAE